MKNRYDIVAEAVEECMKECYKLAQPKVTWEDFKKENKEYIDNKLDAQGIPAPYAFYYLPKEEFDAIKDAVAEAYGLKNHLVYYTELLIEYFKAPKVTEYSKEDGKHYKHIKALKKIIGTDDYNNVMDYIKKFREFYRSDHYENSYNFNVCLGASPNSNKEAVIDNWKQYRNKDITINDNLYEEEC